MSNKEVAKILREIGEYLDMQEVPFKPRAYEKAADALDDLEEDLRGIYERGGLKALEGIPGVGVSIAEKIEELLRTGKLKYYEKLKHKMPVDLAELTGIEGLGPKKIQVLYKKLGIKNLKNLEEAIKKGKIRKLEGFGEKSEENIMRGIEFLKKSSGRFLLVPIMPAIDDLVANLRKVPGVSRIDTAGSTRRWKETIGDIDILAASYQPKKIMDAFVNMPEVAMKLAHGPTKSAVKLKNGLDVDLRVVPEKSYGAALNYFTGSKAHNIALRQLAIEHGWKLNEYGLFKGKTQIAGKTEEELYKKLGLIYIPPEMRENTGEIELAAKDNLPKLIEYGTIAGDLQVQTTWSDGANSIEEMANAAIGMRLEYIAITDHTKRLAMTGGLDEKRLRQQGKEIDKINLKFKISNLKFRILKSTECDILKDGSLDLKDDVLAELDIVGASVHSYFNLPEHEQTERIIKAMKNKNVDIVFHPTGRVIGKRDPYKVDIDKIISVAKETGTVLEINSYPDRSDLKDEYIRKCVDAGVKLAIDSDAHSVSHLKFLDYGISQARRGWAKKSDIINAWPVEKMLSMLK
ncbi:MAG: DNA polymerase/3'-5' exonuclease PolX [Candidatus Colwellbacteria bacterium]|nr:DNA polymerase/3'-5' exonuclease PolX [Candidatus Colwellbacteria bacterium]